MLCIQCFSLEFCLQCPALADFEDWQLGLQGDTVPHLKDLVHICWEPEAQIRGKSVYAVSKYLYFAIKIGFSAVFWLDVSV